MMSYSNSPRLQGGGVALISFHSHWIGRTMTHFWHPRTGSTAFSAAFGRGDRTLGNRSGRAT